MTDGRAVEDLVVGVLGGTGPQGRGLAVRLAAAGQRVLLGSRDADRGVPMEPQQWFFCLKHHTVEPRDGCAERHRLGPYATREEAERALQSVAERNEKLDQEDREWEEK